LAAAVCEIFSRLKFEAALEDHDAGPIVRVNLGENRRLIVQVAGSSESIDRKSPVITAMLHLLQNEVGDRDRVVLALNSWCAVPLEARKDIATIDTVKLAQRVGANIVATSTLFGIWKYSFTDLDAARQSVIKLYAHDGGYFK
jgi:hypothetical protein